MTDINKKQNKLWLQQVRRNKKWTHDLSGEFKLSNMQSNDLRGVLVMLSLFLLYIAILRLRSSMSSVQSAAAGHVGKNSSAHVVRSRAAIWTLISFK